MSIPKKIHYIWLGGNPMPKVAEKCMASWQRFCPDYEIKRWDETNLDINCCKYCKDAYDAKKYAFASDVLRFDILYKEGGIYVDIDVEFLKSLDEFLNSKMFSGFESSLLVNPGVILGSEPGTDLFNEIIEYYRDKEFVFQPNKQETVCTITTAFLEKYGLKRNDKYQEVMDFKVFPQEYFSPKSLTDGKIRKTKNTVAIHHFAGTWIRKRDRVMANVKMKIKRLLGEKTIQKLKQRKQKKIENKHIKEGIKIRVLHLLASNKYSGAENVACQIINAVGDDMEFAYSSPNGDIANSLSEKNITYYPLTKFSVKELKRVIKEFNPTIIHAHDLKAITLATVASGKIPIIAHVHLNHPKAKKTSTRSLIMNYCLTRKKTRHIIWVSNSCFNDYKFKKNVINKSEIITNIIDCKALEKKANLADIQDEADIVYLGRLTYQKNPQRLISITNLLVKDIPNIKVAIIGSGDLMDECKKITIENGLDKNIKFYGFLSNGYGILKNSKMFLLTSRYEGYPMCVLEAQAFGLPIVSPDLGELNNLIANDKTGLIYNTDQEAKACLEKLILDNEYYSKIKANVVSFSTSYNNIDEYGKTMRKTYEEIINGK